jgi:small subunit ribosomal protein S20
LPSKQKSVKNISIPDNILVIAINSIYSVLSPIAKPKTLYNMPNTASAKKALRSSTRKRVYNNLKKVKIKSAYKSLRKNLAAKPEESQKSLSAVFSALDKAVKSNFITKQKAARRKSRVTKMFKKMTEAKA